MAADLAQEGMCQLNAFEGDGASESVSGELGMRRGDEEGEGECEGCGSGAVFKSVLGRPTLLRASVFQLLRFTALRAGRWEGEAARNGEAGSASAAAAGLGEGTSASADNDIEQARAKRWANSPGTASLRRHRAKV